jgi:beta-glucosidase
VACDHYHRWPEDLQLMQSLGLDAYRFSIAWPRILPQGDGPVNEAGLDFYDRLVDGLLAAGITPYATLYHWDLPQALQDRQGGWFSRDIVAQFARYADIVTRRLGDRVKHWATLNEPRVVTMQGHFSGEHAPGLRDMKVAVQVAHHLLLAHGTALPLMRVNVPGGQLGIVVTRSSVETRPDATDAELASVPLREAIINGWMADPVFRGEYPAALLASPDFRDFEPDPADLATIRQPLDWLGVNYYSRVLVGERPRQPGTEYTEMGWEVYPEGLYTILKQTHDSYTPKALYVTENGAAFADVRTPDGRVHDDRRVAYLREHFRQAARAVEAGIPLRGYFVWSLLDNFEWGWGYSRRFGITYVDFATLERTPKDSSHFYRRVIEANAVPEG